MMDDPLLFLEDIDARTLSTGDKIYGREEEIAVVEQSFRRQDDGECFGIVIKGGKPIVQKNLLLMTALAHCDK